MVIGHPLVAIPTALAAGTMLYAGWLGGGDGTAVGLVGAAMLAGIGHAHREASAYRQWQAEWDSLGETLVRRPSFVKSVIGFVLGVSLVVLIGMAQTDARVAQLGKVVLICLGALFIVRFLGSVLRRIRGRARKAMTVTVVAKTIMRPVPLADISALLPDHCQRIMGRE